MPIPATGREGGGQAKLLRLLTSNLISKSGKEVYICELLKRLWY